VEKLAGEGLPDPGDAQEKGVASKPQSQPRLAATWPNGASLQTICS